MRIISTEGNKTGRLPEQEQLRPGEKLEGPFEGELKMGETYEFKVLAPRAERLVAVYANQWNYMVKDAEGRHTVSLAIDRPGSIQIMARYPKMGKTHWPMYLYTVGE